MRTLQEVIAYALIKQANQFRRDGITPYCKHLQDVANKIDDITLKKIAWLHDIVEDEHVTLKELHDW